MTSLLRLCLRHFINLINPRCQNIMGDWPNVQIIFRTVATPLEVLTLQYRKRVAQRQGGIGCQASMWVHLQRASQMALAWSCLIQMRHDFSDCLIPLLLPERRARGRSVRREDSISWGPGSRWKQRAICHIVCERHGCIPLLITVLTFNHTGTTVRLHHTKIDWNKDQFY
jgi:hypothetical protein